MSGDFAVIGLGQFGRAVAIHLVRQGQAVLAVDIERERTSEVEAEVDAVVVADATNEAALAHLGLERMSCVIVAMGVRAKETSIMVTALLRQRGVRRIVSRATSELHGRVLLAVGAHEIVNPEHEMGFRLAQHLANPHVLDEFGFGAADLVAQVELPEAYARRSLAQIGLEHRQDISVLAIRRENRIILDVEREDPLQSGDILIVVGPPAAIRRFAAKA